MKHAFIFGTSLYLTTGNTISYADQDRHVDFLKILSFYHPEQNKQMVIDAHISLPGGEQLSINANQLNNPSGTRITVANNRVRIFGPDHPEPVLDVYQLDPHEYHGLSSHILNEIHSQHPDVVLTIKGHFEVEGNSIIVDNEKMYINGDSTANGVSNEPPSGVTLKPDDVHA